MSIRNAAAPPGLVLNKRKKTFRLFPLWIVLLCMLPGILHYCIFRLYPSIMTGYYSFTDISGVPGTVYSAFLKGRNFARGVYFMPVILGSAVVATIW